MPRAGRVVMFADEDCGFCMRTAAQVPRLGVDVDVRTLQAGDLSTLPIDADRALIEMPAIDADGTVHYGHRAWAAILRTGALPWRVLATAMTHGPSERVARTVYRWVSQNRTRLPGGTPACALPPTPNDPRLLPSSGSKSRATEGRARDLLPLDWEVAGGEEDDLAAGQAGGQTGRRSGGQGTRRTAPSDAEVAINA